MTREEVIKELSVEYLGDSERIIKAKKMAIKALEQEPILDKITEEIQALRGCSCWDSDGIIDDVEDIIDKYRPESEK